MASTILLQNNTADVVFLLEDTAGAPVTGLTHSDVLVDLKKENQSSFSSKTVDGTNFTELSDGFYEVSLSESDTDTLGNLYIRVSGADFKTVLTVAHVAESVPTNPTAAPSITETPLFGHVLGANGDPLVGVSVSARILSSPYLLQGSNDSAVLVGEDLVTVKTDSDGFFTIELVAGADVDMFIPAANYRRTLRVPSTSTNLFSIP